MVRMIVSTDNEVNESTVPFISVLQPWNIFGNYFTAAIRISTFMPQQQPYKKKKIVFFFQQDYLLTKGKVSEVIFTNLIFFFKCITIAVKLTYHIVGGSEPSTSK